MLPITFAKGKQVLDLEEMPSGVVIWSSGKQDFLFYRWVSNLRELTCEVNQGRLLGKEEPHCLGQI